MTHGFDVFFVGEGTQKPAVKMFDSYLCSGLVCLFYPKQIKIIKLIISEYITLVGGEHRYSLNRFYS